MELLLVEDIKVSWSVKGRVYPMQLFVGKEEWKQILLQATAVDKGNKRGENERRAVCDKEGA